MFRCGDGQRGTADNSAIITQFGWDHLKMLVINPGSTFANCALDRLENQRAGFGDTPANNDPIWVQQPRNVGQHDADLESDILPKLRGNFVAAERRFFEKQWRDFFGCARDARRCISFVGTLGDLPVTNIFFQRPKFP
jgi:hypothetical protein